MKKVYTLFIALILMLSFSQLTKAQLLTENFDYPAGDLINTHGWTAHSGTGTTPVAVSNGGLTFAGYVGSGIGNAADVFGTGEDVNRSFTAQSTDGATIYLSALVNVTETAAASGGYFLHLGNPASPTSFTSFCARVFAKTDGAGNVNFGIGNTSTATYSSTNYALNTTYLLVVKYTINTSGNDEVKLWVISSGVPADEATAGTADVTVSDQAGTSSDIVDGIGIRQSSNIPDVVLDGIQVSTTWDLAAPTPSGPAVGDYGSAGDGNWGTAATWVVCTSAGTWTGATVATGQPNETKNVWIRSGHTVTVDASGKKCLNLTVENGGSLVGDAPLPTSSIRYVRIYGTVAQFDGTVGGPAPGTSVALEMYGSFTIQGTGTVNLARIRPGTNISDVTLTIDCDMTMSYNGSSGTGGAAIYTGNSGNDNITITLNQGRTLTFVDYAYLGTSSSTSSDGTANTTFNINGTLVQQGVSATTTLRVATGKTCTLNIGANGSMTVSKNFNASGGAGTVNITNNGTLVLGSGGNGIIDFTDPSVFVGGTGTTTIGAGAKLLIGATAGLDATNGPIRTTTRNFNADCNYDFVGTAAQVTGADLPSTISKLTIENTAGVTLSSAVTLTDTGSVADGASLVESNTNYVMGVMKSAQTVGTGTSTMGGIGVEINAGAADDLGTVTVYRNSGTAPTASGFTAINRSWDISSTNPPTNGRDLTFNWASGDDGTADLTKAVVYKSTDAGSNWTNATDVNGLDVTGTHSITASGVNSFSLWTVGGPSTLPSNYILLDSLKMNNADGISTKLNDTVSTSGIVTSITQLGTGTSGPGTIQTANTAISIYGSSFTGTTGLQIGDSVMVKNWKVTQYNGLTELSYTSTSSVEIISSGHKIDPAVVTISDIKNQAWNGFEKYEGMFVRFNNVTFVQTGTFAVGTSSGANFQFTDGTDTLDFRIVKTNTSLKEKEIPAGHVDLIGFVQQYDGSTPYDAGYQIMPLDSTGVISAAITPIDSIKQNDSNGISKMLNDTVNTVGVVTSILQLGTGTSGPGTIQNANTAVSIYGSSFTGTPGLQIGDSVLVENWKVTQYNGLTELGYTSTSSVRIISSGHTVEPTIVTIPQIKGQMWNGFEKYEGMLLQLNSVHFVQTGTFDVGTSSGVNYQIYNGTDTLDFRVVKTNSSLLGKNIPNGEVNVIGILQQYKSPAPYDGGYQLMPLDSTGIIGITGVSNSESKPYTFQLYQNYPNPFNPSTLIKFEVPSSQLVELTVYDILGRKVRTLYNEVAPAGVTQINFDASNLASGVYIYRIRTSSSVISKKLMLLK